MTKSKVQEKKIFDLIPDGKNVNVHTQRGRGIVEHSIRKYGVGRGIVAAGKGTDTPQIIGGHLTTEIVGSLDLDDVIFVHTNGDKLVVTVRDDIAPNSPEAIALGLIDNESSAKSYNPDLDILAAVMADPAIQALKNEDKILADIVDGMGIKRETKDAEPQIDRAAELREKWKTETGQLWQLGEHRLLIGDCTVRENVERLMRGKKIDCVFTSPPYNQGNTKGRLFSHGKRVENLYPHSEDNMSEDDYMAFIFSALDRIAENVNDIHSVVWNVSYNAKSRDTYGKIIFSDRNPFSVFETIVWNKGGSINLPQVGIYSRQCEFVFVMARGEKYLTSQLYGNPRWNYWETKKPNQTGEHRATFPLEFAERGIKEFSVENNIIYEPFAGTGTAIIAAQNLGRRCYAMEISAEYGAVILERFNAAFPDEEIRLLE